MTDALDDLGGLPVRESIKPKPKDKDPDYLLMMIGEIRRRNNENWMELLKIAFHTAPEEAKKIMSHIADCDKDINELTRKLCEL